MPQPADGRGNLYEQVLEFAKREMDEAASKMEEIKQSLQLLEARVEAAKAVYQAVASRLNLEDETEGAAFESSYPDAPTPAPEPPPPETPAPVVAETPANGPAPAPEPVAEPPQPEPQASEPAIPVISAPGNSDLDIIRQHLAAKAEADAPPPEPKAEQPAPVPQPEPQPAARIRR